MGRLDSIPQQPLQWQLLPRSWFCGELCGQGLLGSGSPAAGQICHLPTPGDLLLGLLNGMLITMLSGRMLTFASQNLRGERRTRFLKY